MRPADSIADLLTRIRNAQMASHEVVSIPASMIKIALTHILKEEGFIKNYKCIRDRKQGIIKIALKYTEDGKGVIRGIDRISTSSRRVYVGVDKIPYVKNGLGCSILSTPKGIMSDRDARQKNLGGEIICSVF
ncbi:MAG: 30S ribosomal protein S8 [Proteobacteria bacterium]|nr:30S ribosomal protein S8 [Pseudomonadota bacterium]